ncbi:hypothetical protein AAF712_004039 [Marasmius tenuissimus]|uniref:RPA43 OB domain-containing protein n=1 Tax=Marasmius tenuissimus TaxID=585030 RepID=A0ABR3A588_9AGAR
MPHTTHSTRKRKHSESGADAPSKKIKHSGKTKTDKKGKGKETEFQVVKASLAVSVPPIFSIDPKSGVAEMLDSMLMRHVLFSSHCVAVLLYSTPISRYIPAFEGVVLSHSNLEFLEQTASIKGDCPFLICKISFDATVWRPRMGMKLVGKINLCSPDHVSLLVHKTFNVSIPRHHIPTEQYEFEYGPAENDPEFGGAAQEEGADDEEKEAEDSGGRWVRKDTNAQLGDEDGKLTFTVVGLTIANEMLSLLGSIQDDPFSPLHVPTGKVSETSDAEKVQVDSQLRELTPEEEEGDELDSDGDEDTFAALGKKADEAKKRAEAEAERQAGQEKKKKKRKNADLDEETSVKKKKKGSAKEKDKKS